MDFCGEIREIDRKGFFSVIAGWNLMLRVLIDLSLTLNIEMLNLGENGDYLW